VTLAQRFRQLQREGALHLPFPGVGQTPARHRRLFDLGREDLSLARLAEAHVDALAILAEAGRPADPDAWYAVWASETPGASQLQLERSPSGLHLNGVKPFCSGAALVDRALVTVTVPEQLIIDVDLRANSDAVRIDETAWHVTAFAETRTATVTFDQVRVSEHDIINGAGWYLDRPGFWHGACGPACCWAGGAVALVDYARSQSRDDPHTLAHFGALQADAWGLEAYLKSAGQEIDECPGDWEVARIRALTLRHLVEQACTDVLRRFARAYGPRPLAFDCATSRRYQELDLYLRQSHAERDLEVLGRAIRDRLPDGRGSVTR
jgi:alkylation response protein AidB-like acyl-CoA dehydrogenase